MTFFVVDLKRERASVFTNAEFEQKMMLNLKKKHFVKLTVCLVYKYIKKKLFSQTDRQLYF